MTEITEEQAVFGCSKFRRRILKTFIVFGFVCLFAAVVLLALVFSLSNSSTPNESSNSARSSNSAGAKEIYGAVSVFLFIIGGSTIIASHKGLKKHSMTQNVVSSASTHIPRRSASVEASWNDFPDYFSTVQTTNEASPYFNAGFKTAHIDVPDDENPPPCYEQAIKMSDLAAYANHARTHLEPGNGEDTRL